ncbi:HU family DNA-binding protein [[Mycoplasma] mobile]|nr:HU family DNA-binding protein [[Mycoplasma] mobile]
MEKQIITKKDLIATIAENQNKSKKEVEEIVNAFLEEISSELVADKKINLSSFGIFEISERAARSGINPKTSEIIQIKATKSVKFKVSKSLKDQVNF